MTISILTKFGSICMDPDAGLLLCEEIANQLAAEKPVEVDFSGVTVVTSSFLNPAFGCLYAKFQPEVISEMVSVTGLDVIDLSLLKEVQENAHRYFERTAEQQKQLACISP